MCYALARDLSWSPRCDSAVAGVQDPDPWKGPPLTVDVADLSSYIGQPPFSSDRIYERTPVGVVMGLAWTSMGGNALYIEAATVERAEGKGSLKTTGVARCFQDICEELLT